ncbi:hypothetical protein [Fibrella aestuarina]|uniref:hypothetical protein n=1 Tax=Fibrella aestuarina TaxID=651143 RepID=UPI0011D22E6E|nr:hypothetical protein [Fibrella aestuarina]
METILYELENISIQHQEFKEAAQSLQASVAYFFETVADGDIWTPAQLLTLRERAGIDKALALLEETMPADEPGEDDTE